MIDVGLVPGVQALWQQDLLLDFTIGVEDRELKVHKVVLASVSEYFRAMITGSMKESITDRVELKGLSAAGVSELIKLVYTGQEEIVNTHLAEVLSCAVYFQMSTIIEVCKKKLLDNLNYKNCFDTLSLFVTYSLQDGVDKAKEFIKEYWYSIMEEATPEDISYNVFSVVFECWDKREWDLFLFIKNWFMADYDNNKQHINDLLSKVRFCLMTPQEVAAVKTSDIYTKADGPWHDLLNRAAVYHKLPARLKISLDKSFQTTFRSDPVPVFFNTGKVKYHSTFYAVDEDDCNRSWRKRQALRSPKFTDPVPIALEVCNLLVVCSECKKGQRWFIFDPRAMTWSTMAAMTTAKTKFALVHHKEHLYALGGDYGLMFDEEMVTADVERYDFKTNKWDTIKKMPIAVKKHAACVVSDTIYVSGGRMKKQGKKGPRVNFSPTTNLDCMDITTGAWEKKASMPKAKEDHKMHLMRLHGEETLVVIDHTFQLEYYNPQSNQWIQCKLTFNNSLHDLEWKKASILLTRGNAIYFLNIRGIKTYEESDDNDDDESMDSMDYILWGRSRERYGYESDTEEDEACVKWEFPEMGDVVNEVTLSDFPVRDSCIQQGAQPFCALLSVSPPVDEKVTDLP